MVLVSVCMCVCVRVCVCVYVCMCACVCQHLYRYTGVYVCYIIYQFTDEPSECMHVCRMATDKQTHKCTNTQIHTHTHTHTHTRTHTHTHKFLTHRNDYAPGNRRTGTGQFLTVSTVGCLRRCYWLPSGSKCALYTRCRQSDTSHRTYLSNH